MNIAYKQAALGTFKLESDAAIARDNYVIKNFTKKDNWTLNFPSIDTRTR